MAMIIHLPDEIIALILEDENISMEDIVNLKSTCNRLQQITFSHKFWEKKFYQRYVFIYKYFNKFFMFISYLFDLNRSTKFNSVKQ